MLGAGGAHPRRSASLRRTRCCRVKRAWPLIAGVVTYAVAVILWLLFDRDVPQKAFDAFSSENTSDRGLSLARRYLTARGRRVALLERPIDVRYLPANAVVFRAGGLTSFFDLVRQLEDEEARRENEKKGSDAENGQSKKAPDKSSDKSWKGQKDTA